MRTVAFLLCLVWPIAAAERRVAITVDDVPVAGRCDAGAIRGLNAALLAPFKSRRIPLTGFVISGRCPSSGLREVLDLWLDAGAELGNHTFSHSDLNHAGIADYQADVIKAEAPLRAAIEARGGKLRWFRHPMLHNGADPGTRRVVHAFLLERGYTAAPVTIDNDDWIFGTVYEAALARGDMDAARRVREEYLAYLESIFVFFERRALELVGRPIPHVLLLHANQLNADALPDALEMIRGRGYAFVSLQEAMEDSFYSLPARTTRPGGLLGAGPGLPACIAEEWRRMRQSE